MKRAALILLAFFLLAFASCRLSSSERDTAPEPPESESVSQEEALPLSPGLYELLRFDNSTEGNYFSSFAVHGGEAAVYGTRFDADTGEETYELHFIDLETGRVSEKIPMDPWYDPEHREETEPDPYSEYAGLYLSQLAIGENGTLILYNPYASWAALYDRSGRLLDMIPYGPLAEERYYEAEYPLLPGSCLFGDGFAYTTLTDEGGKEISAFSFSDDPEAVLLFENEFTSVAAGKQRDIVCTRYGKEDSSLSWRVFDFKNKTVRATVTIPPFFDGTESFMNDRGFYLGGDYALIAVQATAYDSLAETQAEEDRSQSVEFLYLWRFDDEEASPLEAERATNYTLHRKNLSLRDEILRDYEIMLHLDEAPPSDYTPWDDSNPDESVPSVCVTGAPKLEIYRILVSLKSFLSRLPAGFTHEMYTDYPYGGDHKSFDIYVVKEIPGSAAAFASGFSQEQFLICFATDEFSDSHLPHEFMHLIEVRIHSLRDETGQSFWEEWDALNPDGYQYGVDDFMSDWFVTWYASTNSMEDRADTFMRMWQNAEYPPEETPGDTAPGIKAKMRALENAIREAYPSVAAVGRAFWET